MQTKIEEFSAQALESARGIIASGGLVAFATETVYGLGGSALSESAVRSIFEVKGRPQDNPLIVHLDTPEKLDTVAEDVSEKARLLAEAFMPGPLTMVLRRKAVIAPAVSCGLDTVAVRVPEHPGARAFLSFCGVPIAAPSANTSSRPSPTTARHVYDDLNGKIPLILDGGPCRVGIESTVIDMTKPVPVILRPGIVTRERIEAAIGEVSEKATAEDGKVLSPGMKYKHYAPRCEMVLVRGREELARQYEARLAAGEKPLLFCFEDTRRALPALASVSMGRDSREAANRFYRLLREYEDACSVILCECPPLSGEGNSLYNRMIRSAGNKIL